MSISRTHSGDIGTGLRHIDTRLKEIADNESDCGTTRRTQDLAIAARTAHGGIQANHSPEKSGFPSGTSTPWTPWDGNTGTNTPQPVRPRVASFGGSGIIQIKKEESKKWYKYPHKGVKVTTKYFYQEIDSSWTAVLIVACFFTSGLVDAVAFNVWSTFVGMQTGNTIFLAIRIASQPETHVALNYIKSLTSVVSYCFGALAFNCLHRAPTGLSDPSAPLHRWTLLTSFVTQSLLLAISAILAQTQVISSDAHQGGTFSSGTPRNPGDNYLDLIGIAMLAFEAAGQVCLSRVLLINELPTIVLSTLYHDFIGEALGMRRCWQQSKTRWDFLVSQKKQIRRLASILSLFAGALVGGFMFQSRAGLAGALWVAAGIKIGISVAWCVWKKKVVTETVVTTERAKR